MLVWSCCHLQLSFTVRYDWLSCTAAHTYILPSKENKSCYFMNNLDQWSNLFVEATCWVNEVGWRIWADCVDIILLHFWGDFRQKKSQKEVTRRYQITTSGRSDSTSLTFYCYLIFILTRIRLCKTVSLRNTIKREIIKAVLHRQVGRLAWSICLQNCSSEFAINKTLVMIFLLFFIFTSISCG